MADMRRFGPLDLLLLVLVLAVAGGLRAGYLIRYADRSLSEGPLRVQDAPRHADLDDLVNNIKNQRGFGSRAPLASEGEATAHVSPGYPYLVGTLARFVPDRLGSTVRWAQLALGTLTAGLYFLFARRAFRSLLVGTLAGLFAACYPYWIIATATLNDGVLASFALAVCVFLAGLAGEKGGPLKSVLFGVALAGLALVRAALLPFSFVAFIWFLFGRSRSLPGGWLCALLCFLGFFTGLAPWVVRNYQVFHEPVPIVSSAYLHLWIGNNPDATGGPPTEKMWKSEAATEVSKISREKKLNQPARYARLGRDYIAAEVRRDPARTLWLRGRAALAFLLGERWLADGTLAEPTEPAPETSDWLMQAYPALLQGVLLGMLALAFLGWRWSYGWRWESVPAALAVMLVPIPYILGHAEALSGPRLPLDGVLLCFAAFGLVCLLPGLNGRLLDAPDAGPPPATTSQK